MRRFWPREWRPDLPTVGLLMAGLFAIVTVEFARSAGDMLYEALNGQPSGFPAPSNGSNLGLSNLYFNTAQRVASAATFITGVALGVAGLSGLGLLARVKGSRILAVAALGVAIAATSVATVATVESGRVDASNGRAVVELVTSPALFVLGYIALILIIVGWAPPFRSPTARSEARSWMEDAADADEAGAQT